MSDVIAKWRVKTKGNLCNKLIGDSINHGYVLILQGNIRVVRVSRNSWVGNKDA